MVKFISKEKKFLNGNFISLAAGLIFFFLGIFTINNYGISWDEPIHFIRGQAYLHLFLTGETNYENKFRDPNNRISFYENGTLNGEYFLKKDSGHPPLNGIISAFFNYIFFQKLGFFDDIASYHIFEILTGSIAVGVVGMFATQAYGPFAGLVAVLSIGLYPLFLGETHFNIKDPPETSFFILTLWTFWMSLRSGSWRWLLSSVIFFGIGFSIKFNILFLPFIIIPYLLLRYKSGFREKWLGIGNIPRPYIYVLLLAPFVVLMIFFGTWPYLWQNPVGNFSNIVNYYQEIGTGGRNQLGIDVPGGFNLFPLFWITITTPPIILILCLVGVLVSIRQLAGGNKYYTGVLWLIWLIVPILRVSLPNTSLYGGVRQIMEYIPAMALLAGLGAVFIKKWIVRFFLQQRYEVVVAGGILIFFTPLFWTLYQIHPNENVYFNSLIGGIKGAKERNIAYWGNSFGNAYYQATKWLNENAPKGSHLALVQGTYTNIPAIHLRSDFQFSNGLWSGINRNGEYLIELTHNDPVNPYPYAWNYINRFLDPVYEVEVDGVAIAKVWKNDLDHTYPEYRKKEVLYQGTMDIREEGESVHIKLSESNLLTRVLIDYARLEKCDVSGIRVDLSEDGLKWDTQPEQFPIIQVNEKKIDMNKKAQLFIAGDRAQYVRLVSGKPNSCHKGSLVSIYVLDDER